MFTFLKALAKAFRRLIIQWLRRLPISPEIIGSPKGLYKSTWDWVIISNSERDKTQKTFIAAYPKHKINRLEPRGLDQNVHWKFRIEYQRDSPETFVAIVPKGRAWGNSGAVITADDKLLADVSVEPGKAANEHSVFHHWKLGQIFHIDGAVAVLSSAAGETYFHWMFDVLPRIDLLRHSGVSLESIDKFLVNSYRFPFHKETLAILGIPSTKVVESSQYLHLKADKLIVPSLPGITGNMPRWACIFLRREFLGDKVLEKQDRPERIYISRAKANYRKVINEDKLIQCLSKFGFQTVFLESMSVTEQASLFSSAKVIAAPHGAGLTNSVFCEPGTKVIEFFSANYVNVCYWSLSNQVDLEYYYLLGEGENPREYIDPHLSREDISINLDSLVHLLKITDL